ncbi:MAG: aminotransferase class V-fold PLP-dependent enzyme [Planctomycetes bacterium]|nr:aminotransferase class V-fold PLP-dependent enzyme [Planctomycetota bacterium]
MVSRRAFLGALALPLFDPRGFVAAMEAFQGASATGAAPSDAARDENLWRFAQDAFTVDRAIINLNNGGVSPAPARVQDAMRRYLEYSNTAPAYVLWEVLGPQREGVRQRLARAFGCDPEEIAITRNASESLETCQLGLDLERGDEVLTSNQDYPRMLTTYEQRARRDGIVLKQISLPIPCEDPAEIVRRFEAAIGARTRLIHVCHVINITGQIVPVREIVEMARARGIPVIVDGAHSFAHLAFAASDLDCDYFGTSLHKWLFAPHGTGFLFVRRAKIRGLWPLMAAPAVLDGDIRKFEEIGTHPAANSLAIGEALAFHEALGAERKEARLRYLRDYWAKRLRAHERVRLHTSLDPRYSCAIATVELLGIDTAAMQKHLWARHRIHTVAIKHPEFEGLRVTPSVYTTLGELDRFSDAVEKVLRDGLPG